MACLQVLVNQWVQEKCFFLLPGNELLSCNLGMILLSLSPVLLGHLCQHLLQTTEYVSLQDVGVKAI